MIAVFASGWLLWRIISPPAPLLNSIMITVDNRPQEILPGETLVFPPNDTVKITKVSTNILLGRGVRLLAKDFDVSALQYEAISLSALLPNQEIFAHYKFRIWIKHRNRNLGYLDWDVQPYAEDWLEKAERTANSDDRLAFLEKALSILPEDVRIWRRLLEEYKSLGKWKQAAQMLEGVAGEESNRETLIELLDVYTAMNGKDGVISVLRRIARLDPDDINARVRLAEVLDEKGKRKTAIKEYEALLELADVGDRLPIYKRLGYLYAETGQTKKAISLNLKAVKLDKKDANLYYNLADLYEGIHKKDKADLYLAKAISLNPDDVEGRLKLAHRLTKKGKLKKVEGYLSQILKKKPNSLEALLLMARLMAKQGEQEKLKKTYEKILSLDPKNETVIYNLGVLEYEAENLDAALHHFERYRSSNPKDAEVCKILFDIYKRQKNDEDAFKQARILVELLPGEVVYYHYIFDHLKGDYERIINIMEKGLKANPNDKDLRAYLVSAYLKTGKEKLAIKILEDNVKARPKDIDLLLQLARTQETLGELDKALETYERIIHISPGHEEAEEAYLRLRVEGVLGEGER
jgi:tetratricopeptide (TPR) repeat protein